MTIRSGMENGLAALALRRREGLLGRRGCCSRTAAASQDANPVLAQVNGSKGKKKKKHQK